RFHSIILPMTHPPNQTMKPTPKEFASRLAPSQGNFSVLATTPWISSMCPATLVRLKLVRCPHSLAPTLVVLPSMSLGPLLHSLGSRTPAVMLFNASRGLSPSRSVDVCSRYVRKVTNKLQ